MFYASLRFEDDLWKQGVKVVAGVDEVGRGCLAGPVYGAAVIIENVPEARKYFSRHKFADSKQYSPKKRIEVFSELISLPFLQFRLEAAQPDVIDRINIAVAIRESFVKSANDFPVKPEIVFVDGNMSPRKEDKRFRCVIGGDKQILSCALASIFAKVLRDRHMEELSMVEKYKVYHWEKNKGYGTYDHIQAIKEFGLSDLHRRTFCHLLDKNAKAW